MAQKPRREVPSLLIAMGLGMVATVLQILVLRELLAFGRGNELIFSLALGVWLALVAGGSGIGDLLVKSQHSAESRGRLAVIFLMAVSCLLPIWLVAVRFLGGILGLEAGELLSVWNLLAVTFIYLAIPCLILGVTFPFAATLYREQGGGTLAYLWEGMGATLGGLGLVVAFGAGIDPVSIACLTGAIGCILTSPLGQIIGSLSAVRASTAPALLLLLLAITGLSHLADDMSRQYGTFPQYALIQSRYTPYGNLTVVARQKEFSLFDNGMLLAGGRTPQVAEPLPHIALSAVNPLRNVLFIGGGAEGMVEQALLHSPNRLDYVELDGDIAKLARYTLQVLPDDSRLNIITADPRRFLVQNLDQLYDAIVLALGDPISLLTGRVYTAEAFAEARHKLTPDGVLALQVHGAENYLPPKSAAYVATIYAALMLEFPKVVVLPGQPVIMLAYADANHADLDADKVYQTLRLRGINPVFLTREILWERFDPLRSEKFMRAIKEAERSIKPNRDVDPVAFRTDLLRWSEMMQENIAPLEQSALPGWILMLAPILPAVGFVAWGRLGKRRLMRGAGMSWLTGYCAMAGTIIVLYIFQIAVGSLYLNLALLTAASMFGLGIGAFLGRRSRGARAALVSSVLLSLPLVLLVWQLPWLGNLTPSLAITFIVLVAFLAGAGTGAGFAAACGTALGEGVGFIYAMDVAGAALAAVWGALILLPQGGLPGLAGSGIVLVCALMVLAIWEWLSYGSDPAMKGR
jgi:predicted membrane-bound spermidine synthase